LTAHRSASFSQIRPKLDKSRARVTTIELVRNGELVMTAGKDGDDRKHGKTQKVAMSILFRKEATLDGLRYGSFQWNPRKLARRTEHGTVE
jgi:hypothetical protein